MTDTIRPDPDTRHGPLEDLHRTLGAKLGPFGGWSMPIEYRGVLSEHRAVRERVGLFDLSHLGKVDVVGASAFDALQGLLTNDLRKVEVGRAQYHHLLNEHGGVEEDLFVYRLADDRWFLVPNAANKDKVVAAVRLSQPILLRILVMWALTVLTLIKRVSAIWRLVAPCATKRSTSTSRAVSPAG